MRIVCDKTQAMEKGLAGWPEPVPVVSLNSELLPSERGLWNRLTQQSDLSVNEPTVLTRNHHFWDHLYLLGDAGESQYDILRNCSVDSSKRLACIALSGKGFHGQNQRPWQALEGNLHLSISVPLDLESGPGALSWTMLPAVAVMRTLAGLGMPDNSQCGIKWVNDVLCGSSKLAGVISSLAVSGGRVQQGFLGIGLNVANIPDLSVKTCCLEQHLALETIKFGHVLAVVMEAVAELVNIFKNGHAEQIFEEYKHHSIVVGRQVRIISDPAEGLPEEICRGRVLGIKSDLGLIIEGHTAAVHRGRLQLL